MLADLSEQARSGIVAYCSTVGLDEVAEAARFDLAPCCYLFFLLRKVPDDPVVFPKGKWATLQFLEERLDTYAGESLDDCLEASRPPGKTEVTG